MVNAAVYRKLVEVAMARGTVSTANSYTFLMGA
jgi:hypothetical protein